MAPRPQVIARRSETPSPDVRDAGGTTTRLPTALLAEQAQRLPVFVTVGLVLWSFALLLDLVLLPAANGWTRNWRIIPIGFVGTLGSAAMCWYLRRPDCTFEHKGFAGFSVMLMNAALIAAANTYAPQAPTARPEDIGRPRGSHS